jgi:N-acetyl-D-muramate 6-phosphate phosphatase
VKARIDAVLFDLDGTLIDSAPDLAGAANDLRLQHGLAPLPYGDLRPMAGAGARGMVGVAFGAGPGDPSFNNLREAFLARYEQRLLQETVIFASVLPVLAALDAAAMRWGIVTNKVMRFTQPVVAGLGLQVRAAALIGGDSTPHAKPHPEPLLEAARRIGVEPGRCVYVGDDLRDVLAGRAAGMVTLAAGWGYLGQGEAIEQWGADAVILEPAALLNWLGLA